MKATQVLTFFLTLLLSLLGHTVPLLKRPELHYQPSYEYAELFNDMIPGKGFPGIAPEPLEPIAREIKFKTQERDYSELRMRYPPKNMVSTGLYIQPGLNVELEAQVLNRAHWNTGDLSIQVGIHSDQLARQTLRPSNVVHSFDLNSTQSRERGKLNLSGNNATGLIYLKSDAVRKDDFEVDISGAIAAPWFKLGRDTVEEWQNTIRYFPAPWAELEGNRVILTLPSHMIRNLDDPVAVIKAYDQLIKYADKFIGLSDDAKDSKHKSPELPYRIVMDVDTEAEKGNSHAGYPIVINWTEPPSPYSLLDTDYILNGFIILHEIGHLYEPLYSRPELPGAAQAHAQLLTYVTNKRRNRGILKWEPEYLKIAQYYYLPDLHNIFLWLNSGNRSEDYPIWDNFDKSDRFTFKHAFMATLAYYLEPDVFSRYFQALREMSSAQLSMFQIFPQQRADYFYMSLCDISKTNLKPLFFNWKVPVSDGAYRRIDNKNYSRPHWLHHDGL